MALLLNTVACICLIVIGWADWQWRIIRHAVTVPMLIAGIAVAAYLPSGSRANALAGGVTAFLLFFVIWWAANAWYAELSFGFGDVMLSAVLGVMGGLYWGFWMLAIGMLTAGIASGVALATKRRRRLDSIPYGSFLAFGAVSVILFLSLVG